MMSIEGYLNGKRDGGFRKFLPNGQIVLFVTYKKGILDGESREYYDNGEWKITKNYQDGLLEGFLREYNKQGRLQHQIYYHKNIPIQKQIHE
jgi:antitoxin component YwqK of YwqJK toxin-antitoxin module